MAAEMNGPPSLPCWRWTGSAVRSTSAGQHHLLHRRLVAADLDEFRLEAQPAQVLGQQLLRRNAEGVRDARAARQHIADKRMAAGGFEQHGFRVGLERAGDLAQSGLARPALEL